MSDNQIILLFMGPVLAAIGGFLIFISGPIFDAWERRRLSRKPISPGE